MRIRISALDTLFFRDGKPFSMGEDSWADGVFPPYPSVLYGALRTWYIANHNQASLSQLIDESENIKIKRIHYRLPSGLHLPMPLDLVEPKNKAREQQMEEERKKEYEVVKLMRAPQNLIANYSLPELLTSPNRQEVESIDDGLLSGTSFKQYLEGTLQTTTVRRVKDIATAEPKTGIGRDDATNAAADSMLYRVGMRRAENFEIIVELTLPEGDFSYAATFIKLGGEGKIAAFDEKGKMDSLKLQKDTIQLSPEGFKLYLATPAIFKAGWRPDLERLGIKADLLAAVTGKPVHIGGFDMVKRRPKTMYKAVPAGSVYYYRSQEPTESILEKLQGESISDFMLKQGFGLAYVGNF